MDDDGRAETLRLAFATPRAWLEDGKHIAVKEAPTAFGPVSYTISSALSRKQINVEIDLPQRDIKNTYIRLRLPAGREIGSVSMGKLSSDGETIDITDLRGHVSIVATVAR